MRSRSLLLSHLGHRPQKHSFPISIHVKTRRAQLEPQLHLKFLCSLRHSKTQLKTGTSGGTMKTCPCPERTWGLAALVQAFLLRGAGRGAGSYGSTSRCHPFIAPIACRSPGHGRGMLRPVVALPCCDRDMEDPNWGWGQHPRGPPGTHVLHWEQQWGVPTGGWRRVVG